MCSRRDWLVNNDQFEQRSSLRVLLWLLSPFASRPSVSSVALHVVARFVETNGNFFVLVLADYHDVDVMHGVAALER